jgi:hypothetical protein
MLYMAGAVIIMVTIGSLNQFPFGCYDLSRFGKFVEIQFDQNGRISGAAVRTYLLERSRVCQTSEAERNYHCFYMICAGSPEVLPLTCLFMSVFIRQIYITIYTLTIFFVACTILLKFKSSSPSPATVFSLLIVCYSHNGNSSACVNQCSIHKSYSIVMPMWAVATNFLPSLYIKTLNMTALYCLKYCMSY